MYLCGANHQTDLCWFYLAQRSLAMVHKCLVEAQLETWGVQFDKHLSKSKQIQSICRSAHFHKRNISSIRNVLSDAESFNLSMLL